MGAFDLIFRCKATNFDDVLDDYDKEILKQEESGYCYDDPYCANITSFGGIGLIPGIAENYDEATEIILSNTEKWGPAKAKFYYPENFNNNNKKEIQQKIKKCAKLREKINTEKQNIITKINTFCNNLKSAENKKFATCYSCKSKIAKQYIYKCININNDNIHNKCIICHNTFLKINDNKLKLIQKNYAEITPVYMCAYGGWVAS